MFYNEKKKREEYIDISRGLVILLMLLGHSGAPKLLTQLIYAFHMPFFFILSGYLYDPEKWEARGSKALIKTKFKAYMIPYFVLCMINIAMEVINAFINNVPKKVIIYNIARSLFWNMYSYSTRARMGTSTPLWFLPCIFLSTIFVYLIFKLKKAEYRLAVISLAWLVNIGLNILKVDLLPWHIGIALIGASFMVAGVYIKKYSFRLDQLRGGFMMPLLFVIYVVCALENSKTDMNLGNYGKYPMLFIIGSIAMTVCILWFFKNYVTKCAVLKFFGQNTIIAMGFNYAINTYSAQVSQMAERWYFNCVINVILISIIAFGYKLIRDQRMMGYVKKP